MPEESELSVYLQVTRKRYKTLLTLILMGPFLMGIYSLTQPDIYEAKTVILPLETTEEININTPLQGKEIVGLTKLSVLVKSESLAKRMVERFNLLPLYFEKLWDSEKKGWKVENPPSLEKGAKIFKSYLKVDENNRYNSLEIRVGARDPEIALTLTEGVLDELQRMVNDYRRENIGREKLFIESQLATLKEEVVTVQKELAQSGFSPEQEKGVLLAANDLPWQITQQIVQMEEKKKQIDASLQMFKNAGKLYGEPYLVQLKEKYFALRTLISLLVHNFEIARIKEAKQEVVFEMLDKPVKPTLPSEPNRFALIFYAFIFSSFVGFFVVYLLEGIKKIR